MKTKLLAVLAFLLSGQLFAQSLRVEPANWWVGMRIPQLQLLIYGKDIASTTPQFSYPGVTLQRVTRVENSNYLFLDIYIDNARTVPGRFDILFQKNNKTVNKYTYELMAREANSASRASFTPADVMYLITPDRFANGDPANDKVVSLKEGVTRADENGRHGGDLKGVMDHLDYIRDMGFTAIWMTPVLQNDQPNYSYHGYSITDFYAVDARMGSNQQYKELSEKATRLGIKVVMDMVFNHCGSEHWWMKDLPSSDWINFSDNIQYTNHRKTVTQDPHVAKNDSILLSDGWFSKTMPDLNQKNPLMAAYLIQNSIWWIEYAGLGGIRVDTYPYPDMYFMADWTKRIATEYPHMNIVGEEWSENPASVAYWQRGKKNQNGYVSWLPSLMDFPVQGALIRALSEEEKYNAGGFLYLYDILANDFQYANSDNLVVFADNHDIHRLYNQVGKDTGLVKLALAFVLTSRGIPQLMYGTELNIEGQTHGQIRSDFPGGWPGDAVNAFLGKGLTPEQLSIQAFVKKLVRWRRQHPVLSDGRLVHYRPLKEAYVYIRYNDKGKVLVVLNKNKTPLSLDLAPYRAELGASRQGMDVLTGNILSLDQPVAVPARSPLIIEIKN